MTSFIPSDSRILRIPPFLCCRHSFCRLRLSHSDPFNPSKEKPQGFRDFTSPRRLLGFFHRRKNIGACPTSLEETKRLESQLREWHPSGREEELSEPPRDFRRCFLFGRGLPPGGRVSGRFSIGFLSNFSY